MVARTKVITRGTNPIGPKETLRLAGLRADRHSRADLKREAFNLRFQAATNQLERPARIREVRRDIARIKTIAAQSAAKGK